MPDMSLYNVLGPVTEALKSLREEKVLHEAKLQEIIFKTAEFDPEGASKMWNDNFGSKYGTVRYEKNKSSPLGQIFTLTGEDGNEEAWNLPYGSTIPYLMVKGGQKVTPYASPSARGMITSKGEKPTSVNLGAAQRAEEAKKNRETLLDIETNADNTINQLKKSFGSIIVPNERRQFVKDLETKYGAYLQKDDGTINWDMVRSIIISSKANVLGLTKEVLSKPITFEEQLGKSPSSVQSNKQVSPPNVQSNKQIPSGTKSLRERAIDLIKERREKAISEGQDYAKYDPANEELVRRVEEAIKREQNRM